MACVGEIRADESFRHTGSTCDEMRRTWATAVPGTRGLDANLLRYVARANRKGN